MARRDRHGREPPEFDHRFESAEVLSELLAVAGSPLDPEEVLLRFRAGRAEGAESGEVIPTLFPAPPRFPHPDVARRLFQNLLGLWDASGIPDFQLGSDPRHAPRVRPRKVEPPGGPGAGGLDAAYVGAVRVWIASDRRAHQRLTDSFENRQDALLASLDERGLSDQGWGVLRQLAFELHAVLEHADGAAPASVPPEALEGDPAAKVPVELIGLVDQAFARAEQDGTGPVPAGERDTVRALGRRVLGALLEARAREVMETMVKDDDDGGGFTGKRNKSWREIDARKGKSKYHSRQDDPAQQRIERSATYTRYKQAADALFTGGALPEGLAKTFDPDGKKQAQKDAMAKLRELPDRKAWAQGVVEYLEKYPELPEDPYFLDSLLDHPRERIVGQALGKLETMQEAGTLKTKLPKSLDQRLKSLELTSMDPELQQRARVLRDQLRA